MDITLIDPIVFLTNYTFRTMLIGTTIIGATSAALGCFLYLRKQSLVSDVIGHSAVLGVMVAFILATAVLRIDGRSMLVLTLGSIGAATAAVLLANWITRDSRLGMDAAMAICLSLFYGGGMVLMRVITHSSLTGRGGIDKYMFGNASTLTSADVITIGGFALLSLTIMVMFWKEFEVFTFDAGLAATLGYSERIFTPLLMGTATIAIVIGVKAVGLILMIAFAIMPAAAARQWTRHLSTMVMLAMAMGASAGAIGSYLAVSAGRVPTGPVVVFFLFTIFCVSILFAPERSLLRRALARRAKVKEFRKRTGSEKITDEAAAGARSYTPETVVAR